MKFLNALKKLKNPSQDTKKNRIARINHNRNTERDNERNAIKQATIKKNSPKPKVINNKTDVQSNSEELALDNPTYSNLLYEDD